MYLRTLRWDLKARSMWRATDKSETLRVPVLERARFYES